MVAGVGGWGGDTLQSIWLSNPYAVHLQRTHNNIEGKLEFQKVK